MPLDKAGILRDSVNGKNKYCRILIRRRRTPVCKKEIEELKKAQELLGADDVMFGRIGCDISDLGFRFFAGKIFSYLDMKHGKDFLLIDVKESEDAQGAGPQDTK